MDRKPNIVIFMTDQQHVETIGADGLCRTPHLNRYMEEGVAFANAFTNCPMCTPARATALTGLHPHEHKVVQNAHSPFAFCNKLGEGMETIGDALRKEGYRTAYAGKWHVGHSQPEEHGFDANLRIAPREGDVERTDPIMLRDRKGEHVLASTVSSPPEQSEVFRIASAVERWLEETAASPEPFLLFASCIEPHVPWHVPEPYASMYDPADLPEWDNYRDDYRDKPLTYSKHYYDVNYCRIRNDWPTMARALAKYYGLVTMVDDAFGRIMNKLEELEKLENTVVIFTSDHGELMGRHGLVGKNELAVDDLIRIPFVVYGKNRFAPRRVDGFVTLGDLFNSTMELAGAPRRDHLDSRSFVPLLRGDPSEPRDEIVVEHHGATIHMNTIRAIRTDRYKYVYRAHEIDEFYDLLEDPGELRNRIADPAYRPAIEAMQDRLLAWAARTNDLAREGIDRAFANPLSVEIGG
ncbi:sulfatase-like hydrolase/transferase [Paenibacillus antri]|nr:sulfatase-like hydrolase/transferase [Paenibacillus antri]